MTDLELLIAAAVHAQWAKWQKHQNSLNIKTLGLSPWNEHFVSFPQEDYERWNRLAKIPFEELTAKEQKSDLEVAKEIWAPVLRKILEEAQRELSVFDLGETVYDAKNDLINQMIKKLKCAFCYMNKDCSVVNDPNECALEVH